MYLLAATFIIVPRAGIASRKVYRCKWPGHRSDPGVLRPSPGYPGRGFFLRGDSTSGPGPGRGPCPGPGEGIALPRPMPWPGPGEGSTFPGPGPGPGPEKPRPGPGRARGFPRGSHTRAPEFVVTAYCWHLRTQRPPHGRSHSWAWSALAQDVATRPSRHRTHAPSRGARCLVDRMSKTQSRREQALLRASLATAARIRAGHNYTRSHAKRGPTRRTVRGPREILLIARHGGGGTMMCCTLHDTSAALLSVRAQPTILT